MKKGFTLMEMLFVVLVIALVLSFAVPAIRSVRYDAYNSRAKAALRKLVEAQRLFIKDNKGLNITSNGFSGGNLASIDACPDDMPSVTGIPSQSTGEPSRSPLTLFQCGYLNKADFAGLPYTFYVCSGSEASPCAAKLLAVAVGTVDSGKNYGTDYSMYLCSDMSLKENIEDCLL